MQVFFVCYGCLTLYQSMVAAPAFDVQRVLALSAASFTVLGGIGFALGAGKPGPLRTEVPRDA